MTIEDPAEYAFQAIKAALQEASDPNYKPPEPDPEVEEYLRLRNEALTSMGFW